MIALIVAAMMSLNPMVSATVAEPVAVSVSDKKPKAEVKTVVFVSDFHCKKCVAKIEDTIPFEKGVKSLEVSLETKTIKIVYDASKTTVEKLQAAVRKLGYSAEVKSE